MALPNYQAIGTAVNSIGAINPAWPTHAVGDVALLFVETAGGEAASLSNAQGFAEITGSPVSTGTTTNGTRLTVFWCRATSTSMTAPTVADAGNHTYGVIVTYRGVADSGNPVHLQNEGVNAANATSVTFPSVTTTVDNCLVVLAVTKDLDATTAFASSWTNGNLASVTERFDAGTTSGNGGGIAIADGTMATKGATGSPGVTVTSSIGAFMTIALLPVQSEPTTVLNSPADASSGSDSTPTLEMTATDAEYADNVRYEVQIDDSTDFGEVTYYFDGSGGVSDPNGVWSNDSNGVDGSTATSASTSTDGDTSNNYLHIQGTNAPSDSTMITAVTGRIYSSESGGTNSYINATIYTDGLAQSIGIISHGSATPSWGSYHPGFAIPTGGWTWTKLQNLEAKVSSGDEGGTTTTNFYRLEIKVTYLPIINKVSGGASTSETLTSTTNWIAPVGVSSVQIDVWGGGGGGGNTRGGGGGAFSRETAFAVTPGTSYTVTVGTGGSGSTTTGGTGNDSWFNSTGTVLAKGGVGGGNGTGGTGGASGSGVGDTTTSGGNGASDTFGGAGGGSGGSGGSGGNAVTTTPGAAGSGGGVIGGAVNVNGGIPGAGGGGNWNGAAGKNGGRGQVVITYTPGDAGFANTTDGADTDPFDSGDMASFTVQAGDALADGTYYWRARAIDPTGSNTWGSWTSARSFTITSVSTTTQTILGKARIAKDIAQTVLGRARITLVTSRTILGLSRITKTVSQTIQGLSRITASTSRTILGRADILTTATRTILGLSRITKSVAQTILGLSRITKSTAQTILGLARITATTTQTILGIADILKSTSQTILGLSAIVNTTLITIQGISRITKTVSQTITGLSRITVSVTQTILGRARIGLITTKTILGLSRITASTTQTITGIADILKTTSRTIQGLARITVSTTQTILGQSRIGIVTTKTILGISRITASTTRTILGLSRITATTTRTILGLARIGVVTSQTILGKSRIGLVTLQTIQGLSRILTTTTQTILGLARIGISTTQTILGLSRITGVTSRTIQGLANIAASAGTVAQTILGMSRITVSTSRTITGRASIMSNILPPQKKIILVEGRLALRLSSGYYVFI